MKQLIFTIILNVLSLCPVWASETTLAFQSDSASTVTFLVTAGSLGIPSGFIIRAAPLDGSFGSNAPVAWTHCDETFSINLAPGQRALVRYGLQGCAMDCRGEYQFRAQPLDSQTWSNPVFLLGLPCDT